MKLAFVASKKVGNAIKRNRAKRLLRALVLENEKRLISGSYIFVAKEDIVKKNFETLKRDFRYAMKKLGIF